MITIQQSKTADTRTCDASKVTKEALLLSSNQHVQDVAKGMQFFINMLLDAANAHDFDKFSEIDHFHSDFITSFEKTGWWDNHIQINRHHLVEDGGIPQDVNLVDVLDLIVDCVMSGMGRSGDFYPLEINPDVLMNAFNNTVNLLKSEIIVEP